MRESGKNRINYNPASCGFVLVEVLVVAVIVAALAAVAIPVYSGMIQSQRREVAKNIAQTTALSANVYLRKIGTAPTCNSTAACVTLLGLFLPDPSKYAIVVQTGPNLVVVSDTSRGSSDVVQATSGF